MKNTPRFLLVLCGVFLLLDRFFKWQALHNWSQPYLAGKFLGWSPFLNSGAAFGLPVPNWLVAGFTAPIIALLAARLARVNYRSGNALRVTGYLLILSGAVSNFIDRLAYGQTVDYWLVGTGVINLADLLIGAGFVIYLASAKKSAGKL